MKKLLFLPLFATVAAFAQNGITSYPMPTGYSNSQLLHKTCIASDNAGNIWVGFAQIGLGKFDGANWTMFDQSNTPFSSNNVSTIGIQNGNLIWVGTQSTPTSGGIYFYNGTSWTDYSSNINFGIVLSITSDNSATNMWIGTKTGLYKFDGSNWTNFSVANSGLACDTVLSLAHDVSGNILAGTQRGLSIQNGIGWTNFSSQNTNLPNDFIREIYYDATNGMWLGTNNGIGRFAGNIFVPLDSICPTPANIYPNFAWSISKGPHGGVLFGSFSNSLVEVVANHSAVYFYPGFISGATFLAYSSANNKTWIVNLLSTTGINLFAFDGNNYDSFGLGLTPDNTKYLDVNAVRAGILNRGDNHWNTSNGKYEVPRGGGANTIFASSIWIGGMDNAGNLHESAMTYRQNGMDFFPGPLDTTNGTADSLTAFQYDHLWKIQKLKIQEFQYYFGIGAVQNGTYIPDPDIISWPASGTGNYTRSMAPFIDVNGNGIYDPLTGGDYPDIFGDEELYCIYNDNLAAHTETGAAPMKVEVHAAAYAYYCASVPDSNKVINYTTYYDYKIFNRSNLNYDSVYLGMWQDADLGSYNDDYVGCVSHENFGFTCNGDPDDGSSPIASPGTYGAHPPISSLEVLDGPLADPGDGIDNDNDGTIDEPGEKNLLTGFVYYNNDFSVIGPPQAADDYYLLMAGKWADSTFRTYGGSGYGGITPTPFMFDGLCYNTTAWTERSLGNTPGDRRYVASSGPFTFNAGQEVHLNYADIFSRDTTVGPPDTLYYDQAVNDVRRIRRWYNYNNAPSCVQWGVGINEISNAINFSLYPNPASTLITIEYKPMNANAVYEIYDMTGQIIKSEKISRDGNTVLSLENYASGIYLVRIVDGNNFAAKKFIRQ